MRRAEIPRDWLVGCYSIDLYCGHPNHEADFHRLFNGGPCPVPDSPQAVIGETLAECIRDARKGGWYVSRKDEQGKRVMLCPYHAREVPR